MPKSPENFGPEQQTPSERDSMFQETLKETEGKDATFFVMKVLERNASLFELNSPDRVKEQHPILFTHQEIQNIKSEWDNLTPEVQELATKAFPEIAAVALALKLRQELRDKEQKK